MKIKFSNSVICKINSLDYSNYAKFDLDIYGMKGVIKIDLIKNEAKISKISKISNVYKILEKEIIIKENISETPIQIGLKDLVNSIKLNQEILSDGNEGLKSLEAIIASKISLNQKKEIKLPLHNNNLKINSR